MRDPSPGCAGGSAHEVGLFARGATKVSGHRLPSGSSHQFADRVRAAVPSALSPALPPVLDAIEKLSAAIEEHDKTIVTLASQRYPKRVG